VDDGTLVSKGLTKAYSDLVALEPLDLVIRTGEMVALVGHNGSGKSTFLRLVGGTLDATEGEVTVGGNAAGTLDARAATSYLPDEPVLYDDLSVREHLHYISRLHGLDASTEDINEVLGRIGLLHRADDLPSRFSRGLRQKTAIALGLFRPFRVLLIDEPFVGLDAGGKAALLELLAEVNGHGATIVVATHDPQFVDRVGRCLALRDGALVHDGPATPDDVLRLVSV
jgi:ABC-type multidrug transport system ATPase subunit